MATFEAELRGRHFDRSSRHGEGRGEFGLGVVLAVEVPSVFDGRDIAINPFDLVGDIGWQ